MKKSRNTPAAALALVTFFAFATPSMANYTMTMGSYNTPPPQPERDESPATANQDSAMDSALLDAFRKLFAGFGSD